MRSSLIAVAVTALLGGLVIAPVTQQSAEAQVLGGLKSPAMTNFGGVRVKTTRLVPPIGLATIFE